MNTIHYIYRIVNCVNGKSYVGYTTNPERRWKAHLLTASKARGGYALHAAMRKYGSQNFEMEVVLCSLDHSHMLSEMEPFFITRYESRIDQNGYNLTDGGESNYGWRPTMETREKMSQSRKKRIITEETREKMRKRMKDSPLMHDPIIRDKVSATLKAKGIRPMLTLEQQEAKRLKQMGKPIHSDERKRDLSEVFTQTNPMHDPEIRERARKNKIGKGSGARNGRAAFVVITNPEGEEVARGHLATLCVEHDFPFQKFLANSREPKAIQRGEWKGWNIVRN